MRDTSTQPTGRRTTLLGPTDLPSLLEEARRGSRRALAELYREYGSVVYDAAHRILRSGADAEDVTQDVFVGLPEALRGFEGRGSFDRWLKKVAVRAALMRLRGRRRLDRLDEAGSPGGDAARDHAGAVMDRIVLERALGELPDSLRLVFVLKEIDGYSHRETARMLGITERASEVRLFRARMRLRELMGDAR